MASTIDGRQFQYICPKCKNKIYGCPDPACVGFGHHVNDDGTCEEEISLQDCVRLFEDENGNNVS